MTETRLRFDQPGEQVRIDGYGESVIVRMNEYDDLEIVAVDEGGAAFDAIPVQSLMPDNSKHLEVDGD